MPSPIITLAGMAAIAYVRHHITAAERFPMSEIRLIQNRVGEVEQHINRHRLAIDELEKELVELQLAARVLTRLTGASGDGSGAANADGTQASGDGKPEGLPSIPEMIQEVLRDGPPWGLEPRQVAEAIRKRWWPNVKGAKISSIMWRMNDRGDLVKSQDAPLYSLPTSKEAAGASSEPEASDLFDPHAQGREAVPGGGG